MPITMPGGTIHAPSTTENLRARIAYKEPGVSMFTTLESKYVGWNTTEEIGRPVSIAKISVTPSYITNALDQTLVNGTEIKIYVGYPAPDTLWFYGKISNTNKDGVAAVLTVQSTGAELERRIVTKDFIYQSAPVYSGMVVEIAKYVVENYTTLDPQGIYYISTKQSESLTYTNVPVIEILNQMKDILGWQLYEKRGVVYLEPKGIVDNGVILTVGSTGVNGCKKLAEWEYDESKLINSLTVNGKSDTHSTTELFTGTGGAGQSNTLTYPYFTGVKVEITTDGGTTWTEKVGAVSGVTTSYDYTSNPDLQTKNIVWNGTTGYTPPAAADNIRVTYTYPWQPTYTATDGESIETHGLCEDTITRSDLVTLQDVTDYATSQLSVYKEPITRGKLTCRRKDLSIGEIVTVTDARNSINSQFTITSMELQYPQYQLVLGVSSEGRHKMDSGEMRFGIWSRIRRLEDQNKGYMAT